MTIKQKLSFSFVFILIATLPYSSLAKNCLWKITSEKGTLYLQGSAHVLDAKNYPLDPAIEEAYAKSEILVFETDINEMCLPKTQTLILEKAKLPNSKTLKDILSPENFENTKKACEEVGLPISALQNYQPWFVMTSLTMKKMLMKGHSAEHGLDIYFHQKATTDKKQTLGLETVESQINLFTTLAKEDPNELISQSLNEFKDIGKNTEKMATAWKNGDIKTLEKLLTKNFKDHPDIYKIFVTDRNIKWFKKLNTMIEKPQTHMIIVGAGHLSGEKGLLELFKEKGYKLEQL